MPSLVPVQVTQNSAETVVNTDGMQLTLSATFSNPSTSGNLLVVGVGVFIRGFDFAYRCDSPIVQIHGGSNLTQAVWNDGTYLGGGSSGIFYIVIPANATLQIDFKFTTRIDPIPKDGTFDYCMTALEYPSIGTPATQSAQNLPIHGSTGQNPVLLTLTDSQSAAVPVTFTGNAGGGGPSTDCSISLVDISSAAGDFLFACLMNNSGGSIVSFLPTTTNPDYSVFALDDSVLAPGSISELYFWGEAERAATGSLTVSCNNPPEGSVGVAYTHTFTASGGTAPYTFSISAGSLPTGVTLDAATGIVSGTPTMAGLFSFTVEATDAALSTAIVNCSISILGANCNNPPVGTEGTFYAHTFTATGGTGPYTFSIHSGSLPTGITLDSATGVASGTPTVPATYAFTVRVTDANAVTSDVNCSISILSSLGINCGNPPSGKVGQSYSHLFPASGGTPPYTFSITSGSLPPGLTLDTATGIVSGTPTTAGVFPFTIQVTDSISFNAQCSITISIAPPFTTVPIHNIWESGLARGTEILTGMIRVGAFDVWARGNGNMLCTVYGPDKVQSDNPPLYSTAGVPATLTPNPGIMYALKLDMRQIENYTIRFETNAIDEYMEISGFKSYVRPDLVNR